MVSLCVDSIIVLFLRLRALTANRIPPVGRLVGRCPPLIELLFSAHAAVPQPPKFFRVCFDAFKQRRRRDS